ncbi:551_t:CDS:1 [Paraglomus brasilianum]|uniref:551_t:CDS:1 n=1 Tax=Paraglomus brasilianum TaxID=144538 RepID=A0A9N8WLY5_9GLOM|nr:551_t:CDS:1 [Paraglomus brasilianum]
MYPPIKQASNSRQNPALQRNPLNKVASTSIPTSRSRSSRSASNNRRTSHKIPDDLDKNAVFFPKYKIELLINTKNAERRTSDRPPRPPNSFFLMKNALLLILREMNLKVKMPELCRKARDLWEEAPKESKQLYDDLSSKAERLHHIRYPGYTYRPVRRQIFQQYSPIMSSGAMVSSFPVEDPTETVVVRTEEPTYITITTPTDSPTTPSLASSPDTQISPLSSPENYLMVMPTPEASTTPLYSPISTYLPVSPITISELENTCPWDVEGGYKDFPLNIPSGNPDLILLDPQNGEFELNSSNIEEMLTQMEMYRSWDQKNEHI